MTELESIVNSIYQKISQNQPTKTLTKQGLCKYKCEKCKDFGYIYDKKTNMATECECLERQKYEQMLKSSGISQAFQKIGFKEFKAKTEIQKIAKNKAIDYVKSFSDIEFDRNNSIAFLGNCGSGKTHLSIAIANNLMSKNVGVLYMPYREAITKIKQTVTDEINYNNMIQKYKSARALLIDDFAKRKNNGIGC